MEKEIRIEKLYRYPQRKMPAIEETVLVLWENEGIEGDCHADGGERQISLLTIPEKTWMEKQEKKGFCFHKYKENILLDRGFLNSCRPGDLLEAGEAVLELTGSIKSCHPELCHMAGSTECILAGSSRFAKVCRSGKITVGMQVRIAAEDRENR